MERQKISRRALLFAPKPGRSEVELIKKNIGRDGLFADPDFPAEPSSLYVDGKTSEGTNLLLIHHQDQDKDFNFFSS